jgi:hypothetical protein
MKWLALVATLPIVWFLFFTKARPIRHRGKHLADLAPFLHDLAAGTRPGGLLCANHEGSDRVLRFRKDRLPSGERRFAFLLPDEGWALRYYNGVREAMNAKGMSCTEHVEGRMNHRYLAVASLTQSQAYRAAEVACEVMGLGSDATFTVYVDGVPSLSEFKAYLAYLRRGRDGEF